jgi:serine/threonine-protein kinase HipA
MRAAMTLEADADHAAVLDALRVLLAPGSSLGGARPKASVRDQSGRLSIAKFPKATDTRDVARWEAVMLRLADKAGIPVPEHQVFSIENRSVLVMARFDRRGESRVPFLSAMSLLTARDGDVRSYVEIAEELRRIEGPGREGGPALWRRIVFNILASNFDDHLRNHAILFDGAYWALSPAYDLNPVPAYEQGRKLSTAIHFDGDQTASLEVALDAASEFDLDARNARNIIGEVAKAVARWRTEALATGIKHGEIEEMASAFEHPEAHAAQRLSSAIS